MTTDNPKRWRGIMAATTLLLPLLVMEIAFADGSTHATPALPLKDSRFQVSDLLFSDDFKKGLDQWTSELEDGGRVEAKAGQLEIDVPSGATVWWKHKIEGPVLIEYQATVVDKGGPNDRVSDLNCFWMARDTRSPNDIFDTKRSGKFSDYNLLKTYYVGLGGNGNTTTRFRRYIGDIDKRPLLPQHDLRETKDLIKANQVQTIQLIATGPLVQFYRDGLKVFDYNDEAPYSSGWFGFRTVTSHLVLRDFRVFRLIPTLNSK